LSPTHPSLPPSLQHTPRPPRPRPFPYTTLFRSPLLIIRPLFPQVQCRISQLDMVFVKQSQRQQDRIRSPVLQRLLQMFEQAFAGDRKSTRLNSSHVSSSYAVFCLKKTKSIT